MGGGREGGIGGEGGGANNMLQLGCRNHNDVSLCWMFSYDIRLILETQLYELFWKTFCIQWPLQFNPVVTEGQKCFVFFLHFEWYCRYSQYSIWLTFDVSTLYTADCDMTRGAKQGGGGWGGLNPPWILDGGVEHLSTPPDFEKIFLGGVGSP